jgi:capsular polysaccharide biosynthesis protein
MRMPRFTPWLVIATLTAAGAAAAVGYGLTAPKQYRATAQLLVQPVSAGDSTFAGIDVLRDAAGKRTAAESAAVLVRSPQVADAVRASLGLQRSRDSLLDDLDAHVVDASDVVAVTVEDTSPTTAAQLANAFVDALIGQRTTAFQSQLAATVRRDAQLLASGSVGPQAVELARRLAVLRSFQGQPDPTLRRATTAIAPDSSSWPDVPKLVAIGAGIGLAAGALLVLLPAAARRRPVGDEALDERERRVTGRERALAARERDLAAKIEELRSLDERETALEERIAAVTRRELAVARAAAARPDPEPRPEPAAPEPEPEPEPAPSGGPYNVTVLESLVDARSADFPELRDEWESYLYFLRDYADSEGRLPASFDALVEDTFSPILR